MRSLLKNMIEKMIEYPIVFSEMDDEMDYFLLWLDINTEKHLDECNCNVTGST
jgi:hypothetical protein